jgi:DNA-3-methyladenine glycosylase II
MLGAVVSGPQRAYNRHVTISDELRLSAVRYLRRRDPVLRSVIDRAGPFTLQPQRQRFAMLVYSIISQQVSTAAATSIRGRVQRLVGSRITPRALAAADDEQLRSAGVSPQKLRYLRDLTDKTLLGTLRFRRHARLDDESIIAELTQVKGIGVWTAQMFLIFSLGRLDVLPADDLGLRTALQRLYELDERPDHDTCRRIALPWRPYASVACWYCWRSLEF